MGAIQIFCIEKNFSINPRSMNTDAVEHFLGDARKMNSGRTDKVNAKGMGHAASKASACNKGRHYVHGNNNTAHLNRQKRF